MKLPRMTLIITDYTYDFTYNNINQLDITSMFLFTVFVIIVVVSSVQSVVVLIVAAPQRAVKIIIMLMQIQNGGKLHTATHLEKS